MVTACGITGMQVNATNTGPAIDKACKALVDTEEAEAMHYALPDIGIF